MAEAARKWLVRGRVQGVGFRNFVQRRALEAGLAGYAKNLADGRVEVFAQGDAAALEELQGWLHQGPAWSEVRGVDWEEAAPEKLAGFAIR